MEKNREGKYIFSTRASASDVFRGQFDKKPVSFHVNFPRLDPVIIYNVAHVSGKGAEMRNYESF